MRLSNKAILCFVIAIAAALRFYDLFSIPFTFDEISALLRTRFRSFAELIEKGVKVDGHPAGIQVFLYYWTSLFGDSEVIVKLPFLLMGILSVLMVHLVSKLWYNETVGLISAAFMASIQYSVMYSQIARPYISGLFFVLMMVYFWSQIMLNPGNSFYWNLFFFVVFASLSTYNHYFSLLFAFLVGVSGLFFVDNQVRKQYIVSGIIIGLLYLPHLNIFLYQLKVGGVESWLGKPDLYFISSYVGYIFNFSNLSYLLVIGLVIFGLLKTNRHMINIRHFLLFTSWFVLPFLIGFLYSKYVNSVLQYSVLIFSFPFLFFVLFGHIKAQTEKNNLLLVAFILIVNVFGLIWVRRHYEVFYHAPIKQILVDYETVHKKHPDMVSLIDSDHKKTEFYIQRMKCDSDFVWFDSFSSEKDFISYLEKQCAKNDFLYLGCLSGNSPLTVPIIQDYFPKIEEQNNYAGATTYLFSKKKSEKSGSLSVQDFESGDKLNWTSVKPENKEYSICFTGKTSYLIDENTEWGPKYSISMDQIICNKSDFIDFELKVYMLGKCSEIILVSSLDKDGQSILWAGTSFDKFIVNSDSVPGKWITIHHSLKLSDIKLRGRNIILNAYIWNKGKSRFLIDDFSVGVRKGNPYIYGLFEKF